MAGGPGWVGEGKSGEVLEGAPDGEGVVEDIGEESFGEPWIPSSRTSSGRASSKVPTSPMLAVPTMATFVGGKATMEGEGCRLCNRRVGHGRFHGEVREWADADVNYG